jgi:branched-chain amino acid transport system permease protein
MSTIAPESGSGSPLPKPAALAVLALGLGTVWLVQALSSDYVVTLAAVLMVNAALAISLTLSNGLTGMFSLGHPAFMTIGAYVAAILTFPARRKGMLSDLPEWLGGVELSLLPSVVIAGLVGAAVAFLVGLPVLRLRGHYLAVATLGLIVIVQSLATNWDGITRGGAGLSGVPRLTSVWWAFGLLAFVAIAAWRIKFSSLGRAMMATRENELAAECAGIDTVRVRMVAFVIGAFFAALAGALMVHLIGVVTPKTYSVLLAFNLVVMVVIGGQGSIVGALLAASAITILSEALRPAEESLGLYGLSQVIVALCLILVLFIRPQGLFGSGEPLFLRRLLGERTSS